MRLFYALIGVISMAGCSAGGGGADRKTIGTESSGGAGAQSGEPIAGQGGGFGGGGLPGLGGSGPASENCGNSALDEEEACDDGNNLDGDGCASDCAEVTPGFSCPLPGIACIPFSSCGDQVISTIEACDDGNRIDGDGCSALCRLEPGYKCEGEPSVCSMTTCGDGKLEGAENCDDGNRIPFDGCSPLCQKEPDCSSGACASACGDGIRINEECDDGNSRDGDGCSSTCTIEPGFTCNQRQTCERINDECVLRVPVVFRDFAASHSDFDLGLFQQGGAVDPSNRGNWCDGHFTGVADTELNSAGRPVLAAGAPERACVTSATSFNEWYTDSPSSAAIITDIVLFSNGLNGFVNRYGEQGERWRAPHVDATVNPPAHLEQRLNQPYAMCAPTCVRCATDLQQGCAADEYEGNPLFFPIDGQGLAGESFEAKVPAQYGYISWPWEREVLGGASMHNFYFTTEVQYWFEYDPALAARLDFTGDDDVWVFVNGRLAVDLGGAHVPLTGTVVLDASAGSAYGLTAGNVYKISVFHAERKREGSSFRLTLAGFDTSNSFCESICGDGIIALGEECDDGVNDGGYGECDVGCVLGPNCGDGVVQEQEECDDGNRRSGDGCNSGCRKELVR